jgi:urease accessory protein
VLPKAFRMPSPAPRPLPSAATLLLLTENRMPSGATGGAPARRDGVATLAATGIRTLDDLRRFLDGRLLTTGLVAAAVAAAATGDTIGLGELDVVASTRLPSPAARQASRRRGRRLLQVAATAWPSPAYRQLARMPHHAVALGIVAQVGGLTPLDAAVAASYGAVSDPARAAMRLLELDALAVQAVLTGLAPRIDQVAAAATTAAERGRIPVPCERRRIVQMRDSIWEP